MKQSVPTLVALKRNKRVLLCLATTLVFSNRLPASEAAKPVSPSAIWLDRGDPTALQTFYGQGGPAHQPTGTFTFVKDDSSGSSPKFEIVDDKGTHWKVKAGEEARAETAAAHLLWAVGYFTDEDYYVAELKVANLPRLARGNQYVSAGGVLHGVRLERYVEGRKKKSTWAWHKKPLKDTRELSGLRVMMALMNNWDLKTINNSVYTSVGDLIDPNHEADSYAVSDLGATFGKTGNPLVRSKSNLADYQASKFVQRVRPEEVDFHLNSRPFFLTVFHLPNYITRTRMQGIVKHVSRSHVKWLGGILAGLSHEQLQACFRSAGYSAAEVEGFTAIVEGRIAELGKL